MKYITTSPIVSVIIPVYNAELYISQCIESVLNQTYKNMEIIIINDGSTDQSMQVLNNFSAIDKRILIIHKQNEGVSKTRNIGISTAKGKYVTFVDADDMLDINAITVMVALIEHQNADVVRTNYVSHRSGIQKMGIVPLPVKLYEGNEILKLIKKVILGDIQGYTWLLLIRRNILNIHKVSFDSSLSMMEDTKFYVDLFSVCKSIYLSDVVTYNYIINTTSASRNIHNYKRNVNDIINLNRYFKDIYSEKITGLSTEIDKVHIILMTSQIALAVEYPNHSYRLALSNLTWLSRNATFINLYENANFSNVSKYSRLVVYFTKKRFALPALGLFVIRGYIRRFI